MLLIKDIWDLVWHLATRMKFGTCEQNWDLYGTISGLWSLLGPSPKFGTSFKALYLLFGFFIFWDQIFWNRDRDFFSETKFSKIKTVIFFRDQIFLKPKLIPFILDQIFRNRNFFFRNRNQNPQKIGKSFETEKFRNRNANLWCVCVWLCVCVCVLVGRRPACVLSGKCVQSSGRSTPSCN